MSAAMRLTRAAKAGWAELRRKPYEWPPVSQVLVWDMDKPAAPITLHPGDNLTFTFDPALVTRVHKWHVKCE